MPPATVYGAPYSVYVRAARLALAERSVAYELVPVDIFAAEVRLWYRVRVFRVRVEFRAIH